MKGFFIALSLCALSGALGWLALFALGRYGLNRDTAVNPVALLYQRLYCQYLTSLEVEMRRTLLLLALLALLALTGCGPLLSGVGTTLIGAWSRDAQSSPTP